MKEVLKIFIHSIPYIFSFLIAINSRKIVNIFPENIQNLNMSSPEGVVFIVGLLSICVGVMFIITRICDRLEKKIENKIK